MPWLDEVVNRTVSPQGRMWRLMARYRAEGGCVKQNDAAGASQIRSYGR